MILLVVGLFHVVVSVGLLDFGCFVYLGICVGCIAWVWLSCVYVVCALFCVAGVHWLLVVCICLCFLLRLLVGDSLTSLVLCFDLIVSWVLSGHFAGLQVI